jgi:hypothetical protein
VAVALRCLLLRRAVTAVPLVSAGRSLHERLCLPDRGFQAKKTLGTKKNQKEFDIAADPERYLKVCDPVQISNKLLLAFSLGLSHHAW